VDAQRLAPVNLTWTAAGTVAAVLDFGLADRGFALLDLAIALERSAVRWLELDSGGQNLAQIADARALLAGYANQAPLDAADRALLARLLPLAHVNSRWPRWTISPARCAARPMRRWPGRAIC
jgi:Ser/Thr protein kinase RdoA (MazF antagonist)